MISHAQCCLLLAALALPQRAFAQTDTITEAQVVKLAVEQSPSLRAAVLDLQSTQLAVDGEAARYEPVLLLDAGLTRSESPFLTNTGTRVSGGTSADAGVGARKSFPFGTDLTLRLGGTYERSDAGGSNPLISPLSLGPGYGLNARLSLVQPLLRGAGRQVGEAELRAARIRRSSAEHTRDRVASELLRSVLSAYWELWLARSSLAIEERSRALATKQRDEAQARADTGTLAPADVLAFDTAVATREESVLSARTDVERKRSALRQRIGLTGGSSALGDPSEPTPPEITSATDGASARADALAESPLVHERATAVLLAETQARTASDPLRPRLDLEAYIQAEGLGNDDVGAAAEGLGTLQAVSAHVGVTYELPFSSARERSAAARARIAIEIAQAQLLEAKQSVLGELEIALAEQSAGLQRVALATRTAEIARKQLAAEQARLAAGSTTPLVVVQAEEDVRNAELRVAQARAALVQTSLTLDHLTGRLLARAR